MEKLPAMRWKGYLLHPYSNLVKIHPMARKLPSSHETAYTPQTYIYNIDSGKKKIIPHIITYIEKLKDKKESTCQSLNKHENHVTQ